MRESGTGDDDGTGPLDWRAILERILIDLTDACMGFVVLALFCLTAY